MTTKRKAPAKERIFSFFERHPGKYYTDKQIANYLKLAKSTTRRNIFKIGKENSDLERHNEYFIYEPEPEQESKSVFVYKFKGYDNDQIVTATYTTDKELSKREIDQLIKERSKTEGNISIIAEGESMDYYGNEDLIEDWDIDYEDYL